MAFAQKLASPGNASKIVHRTGVIHMYGDYCDAYKRLERERDNAGNEYRHFKQTYCKGRMTKELTSTLEVLQQRQTRASLACMNHPENCPDCQREKRG